MHIDLHPTCGPEQQKTKPFICFNWGRLNSLGLYL